MGSKIALDFGTSNTLVSYWDMSAEDAATLHVQGLCELAAQKGSELSLIPSVIHYGSGGRLLVGKEVLDSNLLSSQQTFRHIKSHIRNQNTLKKCLPGNRTLSYQEIGRDLISQILKRAEPELVGKPDQIAITVPVESLEIYHEWLTESIDPSNRIKFRLFDEPVAAAHGYGLNASAGDVYLVFDFGGGTLDVAVVLFEESDKRNGQPTCRVLGKAGRSLGGADIDGWLLKEVLKQHGKSAADQDIAQIKSYLLKECELIKHKLSDREKYSTLLIHPLSGKSFPVELKRREFEDLLEENRMFNIISDLISASLTQAEERGYGRDDIKRVLMVGGCSLIPAVQRKLKEIFGEHRILLERPLDAVARGALLILQGRQIRDFLQHSYAIKYRGSGEQPTQYKTIVKKGTEYPSKQAVHTLKVKATQDGQSDLCVSIFEETSAGSGEAEVTYCLNESCPTFLHADPPAERGETCFEIEFYIDENRRLLIKSTDLRSGRVQHNMCPVVKLR